MSKLPTIRHFIPSTDKLLSLYADAGWTAYTHALEQLRLRKVAVLSDRMAG